MLPGVGISERNSSVSTQSQGEVLVVESYIAPDEHQSAMRRMELVSDEHSYRHDEENIDEDRSELELTDSLVKNDTKTISKKNVSTGVHSQNSPTSYFDTYGR